ncbi:hypothetical protein [Methanogenium cariaci]|nr:hypothetical protein [Methanogenium cariaci]
MATAPPVGPEVAGGILTFVILMFILLVPYLIILMLTTDFVVPPS